MKDKEEREASARNLIAVAIMFMGIASGIPTTLAFDTLLSANGRSVVDLLLTGFLGLGVMSAILGVHHYGLNVVATEPADTRPRKAAFFWSAAVMLALVSIFTGVSYVAYPKAEQAFYGGKLEHIDADVGRFNAAMGGAYALEAVLQDASVKAASLLQNEMQVGAVCQSGGGQGPCTAFLTSVIVGSDEGGKALAERRAEAAGLQREIADARTEVEQIVGSARLSDANKIAAVQDSVGAIAKLLLELRALVPIQTVETAFELFSRPVHQMGLSDQGAAQLKAELDPYRRQVGDALEAIRRDVAEPVVHVGSESDFQMVIDQFEDVAFGVLVLVALDAVPLLLIGMFMAGAPQPEPKTPTRIQTTPRERKPAREDRSAGRRHGRSRPNGVHHDFHDQD